MRSTPSSKRRLAVAGVTAIAILAAAVPAAAQTGGSGPPGGTTTTPTDPAAPVGPPGRAKLRKDGTAVAPADAPANIQAAIAAGNAIHTYPYHWGGGHRSFTDTGYDCSGAVSYVLHAAGFLSSPEPSGAPCEQLGRPRQGPLDHGLREREPRLHGRRRACGSTPPRSASASTRARDRAGAGPSARPPATRRSITPGTRAHQGEGGRRANG